MRPAASACSDDVDATLLSARPHELLRRRPQGVVLRVMTGADEGSRFIVESGHITVGRNALCEIVLKDPSVSQRHFTLSLQSGEVRFEDLRSRNGSWIGRARVRSAVLHEEAEFFAGDCRLRLERVRETEVAVYKDQRFGGLIGASETMRALFSRLERVAPTPLSVLLLGETGTGKEEVARAIHQSSRRPGPFITVDCGSIPKELADATLLGHARGAFTGAVADRPGPFEEAQGGTIFLDEIGELPLELQPKLLRALDRREVQRVGETQVRMVDVRVIAATNRDIAQDVADGRFRLDLYQRLKAMVLVLPPLRDRRQDIEALARHFLDAVASTIERKLDLSPDALALLGTRSWDGNVRELKLTVERGAYLAQGSSITAGDLAMWDGLGDAEGLPSGLFELPIKEATAGFQREYLARLFGRTGGPGAVAAEAAGYSERGLQLLVKRLGASSSET